MSQSKQEDISRMRYGYTGLNSTHFSKKNKHADGTVAVTAEIIKKPQNSYCTLS